MLSLSTRAAIVAVATITLSATVHAQATDYLIATPMSSDEFAVFMRLHVKPTAEQWIVLHTAHADYITTALALRDGEIEAYLRDYHARVGGIMSAAIEKELEPRRKHLSSKLAGFETKLFDNATAVLGDGHADAMQGARFERERDRLQEEVSRTGLSSEGEGDLTPIVLSLQWSDDELAKIRPLILSYQNACVVIMRKFADHALDASGFINNNKSDPKYASAVETVRRVKRDLQQAHHGLMKNLGAQLEPTRARQVRRRCISELYPMLRVFPDPDYHYRIALRMRGLTGDEKSAIEAELAKLVAVDDRLLAEGMKLSDARQLAFDDYSHGASVVSVVEEISVKRRALGSDAYRSVQTILGTDRAKALFKCGGDIDPDEIGTMIDPGAPDPPRITEEARVESRSSLEEVLRPISLETCRALASEAAASAEARTAIDAAYAAYEERWTREMDAPKKALRAEGPMRPSDALAGVALDARHHADTIDGSLFDALATALATGLGESGNRAVRIARFNRQCTLWCTEPMAAMHIVSRVPQPWNPLAVLRTVPLDDAERTVQIDLVLTRGNAIIAALRQMHEALADREGDRLAQGKRAWAARARAQKPFDDLRAAMIAAVKEPFRPRFEALLLRAANQAVYDWKDAGITFIPARALEGLNADQRSRIEQLQVEFDRRYLDLCRRLVPTPLPEPMTEHDLSLVYSWSGDDSKRLQRGTFERAELNAHTITRLRTILSAEQQALVPQLDRLDVFTVSLDRR